MHNYSAQTIVSETNHSKSFWSENQLTSKSNKFCRSSGQFMDLINITKRAKQSSPVAAIKDRRNHIAPPGFPY